MLQETICTGCTGLGQVGPGITFIRMNHVNETKKKKVKKKKYLNNNNDIVCLHMKNDGHKHVFEDDAPEADRFVRSVCSTHAIERKTPASPIRRSRSSADSRTSQDSRSSCRQVARGSSSQDARSSCSHGIRGSSSKVTRTSCSQDTDLGYRSSSSCSQVARSNSSCSQVARSHPNKSDHALVAAADCDILRTVLSGCLDEEDLQRITVTPHEYRLLELVAIKKWQDCLQKMKATKLHKKWRNEREERESNKFELKRDIPDVTDLKIAAVAKVQEELMAKEKQDLIAHKTELERKQRIAEMKRKQMEEKEKERIFYNNRSVEEQNKQRKRIMEEMHSQHLQRIKFTTDTKLQKSEKAVRDERNKLVSTLRLVTSAKQELAYALKSELENRLDSWRRQVREVQANNVLRAEAKARRELEKRREKVAEERKIQETRHQELRRMYDKIMKDHQVWHKRDILKKHKKVESIMHERERSVDRAREMGFKTAELRDMIRNRPCEEIQAVVRKKNLAKNVTFSEKVIPKAARIIQSCIYIQSQNPRR